MGHVNNKKWPIVLDTRFLFIQYLAMQTQDLIKLIDDHAAKTGLSRATICERATGNSRLYDRLKRRAAHDEDIAAKLVAFTREAAQ